MVASGAKNVQVLLGGIAVLQVLASDAYLMLMNYYMVMQRNVGGRGCALLIGSVHVSIPPPLPDFLCLILRNLRPAEFTLFMKPSCFKR